jgi:hypothetical protein
MLSRSEATRNHYAQIYALLGTPVQISLIVDEVEFAKRCSSCHDVYGSSHFRPRQLR